MKIDHILVDIDPNNDQQPALDKAIYLAKKYDASIELFLAVHQSSIVFNTFLNEEVQEKAKDGYVKSKQRWLNTYVNQAVDAKIKVSTDVWWHTPLYEAVISKALECKADLIIKSTHQHSTINKVFFTPNDWQLLKTCPIPLLLTKASSIGAYKNVLAAIDPGQSHGKPAELDQVILKTTDEVSKQLNANAHVAHCYDPGEVAFWSDLGVNPMGFEPVVFDYQEYIEQVQKTRQEEFDAQIKGFSCFEGRSYLDAGDAATFLPELVDQHNVDLMVMGTSYRSGLLGSTVEKILDCVHCDILAVKAP